nr:1-acyl-sn-glycerol-3-phosphate acyltransferase [Propionibacterium sp.]
MAEDEGGANRELVEEIASSGGSLLRRAAQLLLLRPVLRAAISLQVHGRERLRGLTGPFVVVGNHSSHFDTAAIFDALPGRLARRLSTGAAADYFFTSPTRKLLPRLFFNVFPVDRPGKRLLGGRSHRGLAGQLLDRGVPVLIFPEGTRSRNGVLGRFTPGTARLCTTRGIPCVPAALVGAHAAWPATRKLWRRGRPPVHVTFGAPLQPRKGESSLLFGARVQAEVLRLHDQTARAFGLPTMRELATGALRRALPGGREKRS